MAKFSKTFGIQKTQAELDFVDVSLNKDNELFVDPFALSQRRDRWSLECHSTLVAYFQLVIDRIRANREDTARELLQHLQEPNETRLGLSAKRPQGAGIGAFQAEKIFEALSDSAAVRTGFLSSLEECELMIDGIGRDKISDLTTNVIRGHLAQYTKDQCELLGVPTQPTGLAPWFDIGQMGWSNDYVELPIWHGRPILLVPKAIVRFDPAYEHRRYYWHFVLPFLQAEHINAGTALVQTLKNGRRRVTKKDLVAEYPLTKDFLYKFSRQHPDVLKEYRESLEQLEQSDRIIEVDSDDESTLAEILAEALQSIAPGGETASEYHSLMIGVVEFIFFPKLIYPRKEQEIHQGRKRIDIFMENAAHQGIFFDLPNARGFPCQYVPFECKNYVTEVANPELDQLAGRFSANRGRMGFLCCRQFENRGLFIERCRDTYGDDRGLILPLDDQTVLRFLDFIRRARRHELDRQVADLVAEVWLN